MVGVAVLLIAAAPARAASIAGTVTDAFTHGGLEGVLACAYEALPNEAEAIKRCAEAEAGGEYTISQVPAGSYKVGFYPQAGSKYLWEFYDDRQSWQEADPVAVLPDTQTAGIDAALEEEVTTEPPVSRDGGSTGPPTTILPATSAFPPPAPVVQSRPLRCKKGFRKKRVRGKVRCVRARPPNPQH